MKNLQHRYTSLGQRFPSLIMGWSRDSFLFCHWLWGPSHRPDFLNILWLVLHKEHSRVFQRMRLEWSELGGLVIRCLLPKQLHYFSSSISFETCGSCTLAPVVVLARHLHKTRIRDISLSPDPPTFGEGFFKPISYLKFTLYIPQVMKFLQYQHRVKGRTASFDQNKLSIAQNWFGFLPK